MSIQYARMHVSITSLDADNDVVDDLCKDVESFLRMKLVDYPDAEVSVRLIEIMMMDKPCPKT